MVQQPLAKRVSKDLQRLKDSKHGWGQSFYGRLLKKAGFLPREGKKHTIYVDPDDAENVVIVPRHGELLSYVADQAVVAIEKRIERLKQDGSENS
jgi:hypothetical protein